MVRPTDPTLSAGRVLVTCGQRSKFQKPGVPSRTPENLMQKDVCFTYGN